MFNEHLSVTGECKGTYEVFLIGFNLMMVHKGVENVSLIKLYWKCMIGTLTGITCLVWSDTEKFE